MPILTVILNVNIMKVSFIVLIIAAIMSASAANSQYYLRATQFGTRLSATHNYYAEPVLDYCAEYYFSYRQRVTIDDGKSEFAATDVFLKPREYSLELFYSCEGYYYYVVYPLEPEFKFNLENSAMFVKADNKPTKICKLDQSR